MLQVKLVPYHEQALESEKAYIFTENLNMTIENLERNNYKVIDVDFMDTKETSYAVIKYDVQEKAGNDRLF